MALAGCNTISTKELTQARDLKETDDQLNELLVNAIKFDNKREKKDIALIGTYAHDTANKLATEGELRLALSYYRIATIAYWRDDIENNNNQVFVIAKATQDICTKTDSRAPDRDCFITRFTPYFAAVESILLNDSFNRDNILAFEDHAKKARELLEKLGQVSTMENTDIGNGILTNFIIQSSKQRTFLNDHKNLNEYICKNIQSVFDSYLGIFGAVKGKFGDSVSAENPLIQEYIDMPGEPTPQKQNLFIASKVSSCRQAFSD